MFADIGRSEEKKLCYRPTDNSNSRDASASEKNYFLHCLTLLLQYCMPWTTIDSAKCKNSESERCETADGAVLLWARG